MELSVTTETSVLWAGWIPEHRPDVRLLSFYLADMEGEQGAWFNSLLSCHATLEAVQSLEAEQPIRLRDAIVLENGSPTIVLQETARALPAGRYRLWFMLQYSSSTPGDVHDDLTFGLLATSGETLAQCVDRIRGAPVSQETTIGDLAADLKEAEAKLVTHRERSRLSVAIEKYLRTRQLVEVSTSRLENLSDDLARQLLRSGIRQEHIDEIMTRYASDSTLLSETE